MLLPKPKLDPWPTLGVKIEVTDFKVVPASPLNLFNADSIELNFFTVSWYGGAYTTLNDFEDKEYKKVFDYNLFKGKKTI